MGNYCPEILSSNTNTSKDKSLAKLESHSSILVIAGSETTVTALSGVTYFLLTNPNLLLKLAQEVRATFSTEGEININSVSQLPYMLACLDEALRMYPPVAIAMVPWGGSTINAHFVPKNVSLDIWLIATVQLTMETDSRSNLAVGYVPQ